MGPWARHNRGEDQDLIVDALDMCESDLKTTTFLVPMVVVQNAPRLLARRAGHPARIRLEIFAMFECAIRSHFASPFPGVSDAAQSVPFLDGPRYGTGAVALKNARNAAPSEAPESKSMISR